MTAQHPPLSCEKRLAKRLPSSRPVILIINNRTLYAIMTDFSKHGIGFMSDEALPRDARLEVHFDVACAEQITAFQFKAEVKHCYTLQHQSHIGVKLDFPNRDYLRLYEQLASA